MLTSGIKLKNFKTKVKIQSVKKKLDHLIKENNHVIQSLCNNYKDSFKKKQISKYKKSVDFRLIGMGGSSLGAQTIFSFLKHKIKKNFLFVDNLMSNSKINRKKIFTNLIISKSGNTIETIVNSNILINNKDKNIFITENKKNYLYLLAEKLKSEIISSRNLS